jgi:hypothetical protein
MKQTKIFKLKLTSITPPITINISCAGFISSREIKEINVSATVYTTYFRDIGFEKAEKYLADVK